MLSTRIRFALIVLLLIGGGVSLSTFQSWTLPLVMWSVAAMLWFAHFRYGTIVAVLFALQRGEIARAEELLLQIRRPHLLSARYRGFYYFAKGLICFNRKEIEDGTAHLKESLNAGLQGKQELGIVYINLAHAYFYKNDKTTAREYLQKAKEQELTDLHFKQRMEELSLALQEPNLN